MGLRSALLPALRAPRKTASWRRVASVGAAIAFASCLSACAMIEHSLSIAEFAGRTLSTRGGEGSQRLETEIAVDSTLRDFINANGRPDYLHVVDRMSLYFFYVRDDKAVKFEREVIPPSVAYDLGRISGSLLKLLPKREVDALLARRGTARRRHVARETARLRAAPRPAARAPVHERTLSRFDVRSIVGRMRSPLTAADSGVSGWRAVKFSDGVSGSTASHGDTRYEVRSDRLVVAMAISGSRSKPPPQARLEVLRANSAVFGAHARAVTEHVMELMRRTAADLRGRSPVTQRIRGRTVHIERVPQKGLLVYAVRP